MQWGAEWWFFGAHLEKAYNKTVHEFILAGLADVGVPLQFVWWIARFLGGLASILVANTVVGDPFTLELGIRQGDPLSPTLFVFAASFLISRIQVADLGLEQFWYVDDSMIDFPPRESVLRKVLGMFDGFGTYRICDAAQSKVSLWRWSGRGAMASPVSGWCTRQILGRAGRRVTRGGGRAVLKGPDFFLLRIALKDRPKGPPIATNRQAPPTANRRQPPTVNRCQPPISNCQLPQTGANRRQPPTTNRQPAISTSRPPPIATNHG